MVFLRKFAVAAIACGLLGPAAADTLKMQDMTDSAMSRPSRGMTQASVQSRYGEPVSRVAAVGDPPISRWHYQDFIVYFEYDRVIHSVVKR